MYELMVTDIATSEHTPADMEVLIETLQEVEFCIRIYRHKSSFSV